MTLAAGRAGAGIIRPPTDADERDDDRDARCVGRSPWIAPPTSGGELGRLGACGRPWLRRASCATPGPAAPTNGAVPAGRRRRRVGRERRGGPRPGPPGCALARGRGG